MNGGRAILLLATLAVQAGAQSSATKAEPFTLAKALESTLRDHPLLHAQEQQVQFARGELMRAQSQFDRLLQTGANVNRIYTPLDEVSRTVYNATSATTNFSSIYAGASQEYHNGITAGPSLMVTRTTDNVATQYGLNQYHLGYQVVIPLLRGRGRDVVGAPETAAGMEVDAGLLDLNQTVSDLLVNTAAAYWGAVSAHKALQVYRDAETRGRLLLENVRTLIEADRIPRSDISEVQANLAARTASRIAADQQYLQARQRLAVAMGVSAENMFLELEAVDPLPVAGSAKLPSDSNGVQSLIADALRQRADYLAAKKRGAKAELLAGASKNQLKPQLDLTLSTGYSGLHDGVAPGDFLIAPFTGVHGVDAVAGIRYQLPQQNRAARAAVVESVSNATQANYRSQDVARNIASSVIVSVEGVRNALRQREEVDRSVSYFQTALENERAKYSLGVGSLVEVLTVEDRLTSVLVQQVQAELSYASAIALMRQATGSVVEPDKTVQTINPAVFLAVPEASH